MAEPLVGILTFQGDTYRDIAQDDDETLNAGLIVLGVGLATTLMPLVLHTQAATLAQLVAQVQTLFNLDQTGATAAVVGGLVALYLVQWLVFGWLLWMVSMFFGGGATFPALLRVLGYISLFDLIGIIPVPFAGVVGALLGLVAYVVAMRAVADVGLAPALGAGCIATILWPIVLGILLLPLLNLAHL